jgi:anti-sigma regulatory factor (Ser/Thr protein kinase)
MGELMVLGWPPIDEFVGRCDPDRNGIHESWMFRASMAVVSSSARTEVTLPADVRSISESRSFVARAVRDVVDDPDPVVLMTSELVTNVVLHANTDVTVSITRGPPVRVEVRDGAAATEAFRELIDASTMPSPSSTGGRGLVLVKALASRVGFDDDPDGGKVVWFEY